MTRLDIQSDIIFSNSEIRLLAEEVEKGRTLEDAITNVSGYTTIVFANVDTFRRSLHERFYELTGMEFPDEEQTMVELPIKPKI